MKRMILLAAAILAPAAPAISQTATSEAAVPAVDPVRLAAARLLIDQIFPPATREQMMNGMMAAMTANIRQPLMANPEFAAAVNKDPRVKTIFDAFVARQFARSTQVLNANLPGMADAMAHAYARRFDISQLHDLSAFFSTPTGKVYTANSMTIMSDPDIAAWQRNIMTQSMKTVQSDIADLVKQITALQPPVKTQ